MQVRMFGYGMAIALALGVSTPVLAQDVKAAEVLARTRKVLGDGKLDTLRTLSLEAAISRNIGSVQLSSNAEVLVELPDKYVRAEEQRSGMGLAMTAGFNGDKAIMPGGGSMMAGPGGTMTFRMGPGGMAPAGDAEKPAPELLAEMQRATVRAQKGEISRLMLGWFGMAHPALNVQYTYAGEAESADGRAHVIDVKDNDGFAARLFIDQNNYLPLMVSYQGRAPRALTAGGPMTRPAGGSAAPQAERRTRELTEQERNKVSADMERLKQSIAQPPLVEITLFFDDWREVGGVQFPHVLRRASEGSTTEEWTITKVKLNAKLDAKKFAVETK